jgi:hypothetical protein
VFVAGQLRALLLIVATTSAGCVTMAPNPARGSRDGGEPLRVENDEHGHYFSQGRYNLDEQDFFAIAGDKTAAAAVKKRRDEIESSQRWAHFTGVSGIGLFLAGFGVMAAGGVLYAPEHGGLAFVPGGAVVIGGGVAAVVGILQLNAAVAAMGEPVLPRFRAEQAARAYNEQGDQQPAGRRRRRR